MVTVIVTIPASLAAGAYVKSNGDVPVGDELIEPVPFAVMVTNVALPENVLPLTVTGEVPQVLPLMLLNVSDGPFSHPHDTEKLFPVVVQPEVFITVIEWLPFATRANVISV